MEARIVDNKLKCNYEDLEKTLQKAYNKFSESKTQYSLFIKQASEDRLFKDAIIELLQNIDITNIEDELKNSKRYKWLRDNGHLDIWWSVDGSSERCKNIDEDIDAAILENEIRRLEKMRANITPGV